MDDGWFKVVQLHIDFYLTSALECVSFALTENKSIVEKHVSNKICIFSLARRPVT